MITIWYMPELNIIFKTKNTMKLTKLITSFVLMGFITSCGGSQEKEQGHESHEQEAKDEHHEEKAEAKLMLNNGAKWEADEPTFNGMKDLSLAITTFNTANIDPTQEQYTQLGNQLAGITKEIISKCSMKGPDHDQLHIVLAPMLANVDVIKNGKDVYDAKKNIDGLRGSLEQFFAHFELK